MRDFSRYVLHNLCGNGWKWEHDPDNEEYETYTLTFLSLMYDVTCYAIISEYEQNLQCDGHYGVMWLEFEKEYRDQHNSENDLKDMLYGFELAEDNLLRCGVPFTPDYKFHGRNRANMKRKNDALRRKLHLDELEEKDNAER